MQVNGYGQPCPRYVISFHKYLFNEDTKWENPVATHELPSFRYGQEEAPEPCGHERHLHSLSYQAEPYETVMLVG